MQMPRAHRHGRVSSQLIIFPVARRDSAFAAVAERAASLDPRANPRHRLWLGVMATSLVVALNTWMGFG